MPKFSDWKSGGTSSSGGDSIFLKLQSGSKYTVRLIDKPLHYAQFWGPVVCRSPGVDEKTGKVVCPLMQMGEEPKDRYAIWVIDRNDDNRLKVMDFPPSLFNFFKRWHEDTGDNPGGMKGCDWVVRVSKQSNFTKYEATTLDRVPFTEAEMKMMKEGKLKERLVDMRRDNTPDEIHAMLSDKGINSSPSESTPVESRVDTPDSSSESTEATSEASSGDDFKLDF